MAVNSLIGPRLKRLREEQGLSMRDLSDRSGVSFAHIGLIESGKRSPSDYVTEALAVALGVTSHFLQTGDRFGTYVYLTFKEVGDLLAIREDIVPARLRTKLGQVRLASDRATNNQGGQ